MKSHVHAFSSEYRRLLGSTALPPEIAAAYEIENCLHETAEKAVFLVRGRADGKAYVLKIASRQSRENLAAEYALLSVLSHPFIPKAFTYCEYGGISYLVREYIHGKTLSALMDEEGPLPARRAADIVLRLCDALSYLHHQNPPIIHRDIKPQNVLLASDGRCVLIDFGIARRFDGNASQDTVYMGTQATAAPEQFGYRQTDVRTDVYSTGILLLYLFNRFVRSRRGKRRARAAWAHRAPLHALRPRRPVCRHSPRTSGARELSASHPPPLYRRYSGGRSSHNRASPAADAARAPARALSGRYGRAGRDKRAGSDGRAIRHGVYVRFPRSSSRAVRQQLGMDADTPVTLADLDSITGLYLCGTRVYETWDEHSYYSGADHFGGEQEQSVGAVDTLTDIANMHNLRELALFNQKITDLSPLEGLPLTKLGLGGNQIADASLLSTLTGLTDLLLENNPLSDIQPLQTLSALQSLDLTDTSVSDIAPLAGLPLSFLSLSGCPVQDCSPLLQLPRLSWLLVSDLAPEQAAVCGKITTLVDLSMDRCNVTSLDPFLQLINLSFLDLQGNELTSLSGVEAFTKLKGLSFWDNPISDLSPVASLKNLTYLNIGSTTATDFAVFAELPALEKVDCSLDQQEAVAAALRGRDVTVSAS